jgi:selenium-binding protein 1
MVSSEFGSPCSFIKGFNPSAVSTDYGNSLTFWNWKEKTMLQKVNLGNEGLIPLELRFLHNPSSPYGFVGCALSSTLILIKPG